MPCQPTQPLNDSERRWIAAELCNARTLIDSLIPGDSGASITPELLDKAFKIALSVGSNSVKESNAIINAVGIAFGQYLVDSLGFRWVVVLGEGGGEIAVVALEGKADFLVFPPNLVAKRWESKTADFLSEIYQGIEIELRNVSAGKVSKTCNNPSMPPTAVAAKRSWFQRIFGR